MSVGNNKVIKDAKYTDKRLQIIRNAPNNHRFKDDQPKSSPGIEFYKAVKKEYQILLNCLPEGIIVRAFEDRLDLYSAMILGPVDTPYEGSIFLFDLKIPETYPQSPPKVHFYSYLGFWDGGIHPNLYNTGTVCLSILGTWAGPRWDPKNSSILQVLVSIQGLVLVKEPYYSEPIFDALPLRKLSANYNRLILKRLLRYIINLTENPIDLFKREILQNFQNNSLLMLEKIQIWTINQQPKCTWNYFFRSLILKEEVKIFNFPIVSYTKKDLEEIHSLANKARDKIEQLLATSKLVHEEDIDTEGVLKDILDLDEDQNFTGYDYNQPTFKSKIISFLYKLILSFLIFLILIYF